MTRRLQRIRPFVLVGVAIVVAVMGVAAFGLDLLRRLELDSVDARFAIRGATEPPADLIVVEIDDVTFSELDLQWPFPRSLHARAIRRLDRAGAKVIAYDIQFSERTNLAGLVTDRARRPLLRALSEDEDVALLEAQRGAAGKVVLSTTEVGPNGEPHLLVRGQDLALIGARAGNTNVPPDPEGVLRRIPYEVDGLESFAVVTTEVATGQKVARDSFDSDGAWIDYHGDAGTIPSVSFSRLVRGQFPRGLFDGKVVVVGASAPSLQDVHPTPTAEAMPGAEIQANAISTVRSGNPLDDVPGVVDVLLILAMALGPPLASLRWRTRTVFIGALVGAAAYVLLAQLLFNGDTIVSVVYPLGVLALSSVGTLAVHYVTTAFEREHVRDLFSRFVPEQVVDEVLDRTEGDLRLAGVRRLGTVMFSDLRNFTSFAESLPPERVIEVLNRYLSEMSDAIMDEGGTLVAYMGDGIMCVFGAPLEQDDHADRALAAARAMLKRLEVFNEWVRFERLGEGFELGIGINSGYVMSGNVGSDRRLEYTAVGDTTNTAARLEGMTKDLPCHVVIADSTRCMLTKDAPDLVFVDSVPVRGRKGQVKLWSLAEPEEMLSPALQT